MKNDKPNKNPHEGSNFYDHLKEKGIYEEVQDLARKRYQTVIKDIEIESENKKWYKRLLNFVSNIFKGKLQ